MRALLKNPIWARARKCRAWQRLAGAMSGIFFAVALVALVDGLIAQMRTGNNGLELLPGEVLSLSGPAGLKNPLASDVRATFTPENAPLVFELEGFFTGYWFGSGMWRGQVRADDTAEPGRYELRIAFKGSSARNTQQYFLTVYADAAAMREASLSRLRKFFGLNPFLLATACAVIGILGGLLTYIFGLRFANFLKQLGLAEIYAANGKEIWCLVPENLVPHHGNSRLVLNADGTVYGEARAVGWQKGKLRLILLDQEQPPANGLICLKHPDASAGQEMYS